ncbi:MAG: TetR/AcrR family transcriptional regulator [Proteobacteria bacterium]|nr:TetR/AcrR family transcriptional regulator [Pseudomonadota bacterium]MBU4295407.1 TetR/AcrR family transcriptional regulator [Pseudomonadota bacterium]MCG2748925.1 TetR/AcrR family transcriptional regulator [Desulfobulbaceae bacterium]
MSRRETTKLETRQLILEAARKLFHTKGPEQCTMRDIAKEAGVSPASVVVHFKSKTALLEVALYEDIERTIANAVATMPHENASLHDRLMHIAHCMYGFYDNDRELYRVLIRDTTFEKAGENPYLTQQLEDYLQFFGAMIEQEKAQGTVQPAADARIAAASLFSLYFTVLMEFLRNPNMTLDMALGWLAATAHQHLTGILTPKEVKEK